ncbi:hypothetical protein DCC81_00220 [Chitinophaga parva]|uniref:Uncharacterized protein n=1 Tax=Chitinophaga parva TaxID=2169414 RepID=A0A2T7BJW3_9BACT|nr:hypothetical protein [Chitinophaga parva]PUZ27952.1 hypothetical protein DCC81_00220 [Chitinophaga parva]
MLTPEERALVFNTDWLRMKHGIMDKVMHLLGQVQDAITILPAWQQWPEAAPVRSLGAKISKGERYKDLPYVILDYPRLFSREDIFALRTMFWWGHDFTATLHLAGHSLARYRARLESARPALEAAGAQLYILEEDPWHHEIGAGIYQPLSAVAQTGWEQALDKDFVKLARSFDLGEWEQVVTGAAGFYGEVLAVLKGA